MNTLVNAAHIISATAVREGAGVIVHRTIGTAALRNYDPFLLLDHFSSDNPNDYIAGFPPHPHRGFVTFTYMLDGHMQHQDSMGNTGNLGPGAAQWMKAASGVIHSEMPQQENGLLRGFQLWVNLPAANKMDHPEYQEFPDEAFPIVETEDYQLKVLIGRFGDAIAPIQDDLTQVIYLDVTLQPNHNFQYQLPAQNASFIYIFEGNGQFNGQSVAQHSLVIADTNDNILDFTAGKEGARFIMVSGKPTHESIVQHGPFVMNTREEIDQALQDYQTNQFVRDRAWVKRK